MTLLEWMHEKEIDPNNGIALSVGTDGVNVDKHDLMSISYRNNGNGETLYVRGAAPEKVANITGVVPEHYYEKALGKKRVDELLTDVLKNAEFLIVYSSWSVLWLTHHFGELLRDRPYFDVIDYAKLRDLRKRIPIEVDDMHTLATRMESSVHGIRSGYAFEKVCTTNLVRGLDRSGPSLENKVKYLWDLYKVFLTK